MAIQRLDFYGYRSFEQATWEPGNLNLLVGPNASGKSNLLRLLELISNVARGKLAESINQAGGMVPLLWNQEAKALGWELTLDPLFDKDDDMADVPLVFKLDIHQLGDGSGYRVTQDLLWTLSEQQQDAEESRSWVFKCWRGKGAFRGESGTKLEPDEHDANESLLGQGALLGPISFRVKRAIEAWRIDADIEAGYGSEMRQPAITQPSTRVLPLGGNLATVLHTLYTTERDFRREIIEGMRAAFGEEFEELVFQPASAQRIQLAVQWRSCRHPHAGQELSDGTLRFLFLLTVLADPNPAPLIAIDEPETGLHPRMFPIVAEYAAAAAERTQVVITSHSPEFLDAFGEHDPHVTVCHWKAGRTRLLSLPEGKLQKWLQEYRLGHLFTNGDLEALAAPEVDVDDAEDRLADLPPEDAPLPPGSASTEGAARG